MARRVDNKKQNRNERLSGKFVRNGTHPGDPPAPCRDGAFLADRKGPALATGFMSGSCEERALCGGQASGADMMC